MKNIVKKRANRREIDPQKLAHLMAIVEKISNQNFLRMEQQRNHQNLE